MTVNSNRPVAQTVYLGSASPAIPAKSNQETTAKIMKFRSELEILTSELRPYEKPLKEINDLNKEISNYTSNFLYLNNNMEQVNNLFEMVANAKRKISNYDELQKKELKLKNLQTEYEELTQIVRAENSDTQSTSDDDE